MAEAAARLWLSQANSDLWAVDRVYDPAGVRSYCQAVAKCQQVVEKSVKAIAAAMRDRLLAGVAIGYAHDVSRLASGLRRSVPPTERNGAQYHVNRLFNVFTLGEIKALDDLAPRRPPPGSLHARNPEYPYERLSGDWTTPALEGFTTGDVHRFRPLARRVYTDAQVIVSALTR